jgi:hypothetical protein
VKVKQLVYHRGDKRRFAAAAQAGHRQTQMPVNATVHQRLSSFLSRFIAVLFA